MKTHAVLRLSTEFTPAIVGRLRAQLRGRPLAVIHDDANILAGVENIPMKYSWPGWWSKMELFCPDIEGDIFYLDLDTTILGDIQDFATFGKTALLSDFYRPKHLQSSMMYLTAADREHIWRQWIAAPDAIMARYAAKPTGQNGDQNFIEFALTGRPVARWQEEFSGRVLSFKVDVQGKPTPPKPDVLIFHGRPRPWFVPLPQGW